MNFTAFAKQLKARHIPIVDLGVWADSVRQEAANSTPTTTIQTAQSASMGMPDTMVWRPSRTWKRAQLFL
jgi:hypothetical protein